MGYRSDVMCVIYPSLSADGAVREQVYNQLKVLMATRFAEVFDDWLKSCMHWVDDKCTLKFVIDDVKWYESYPEVQAFMRMLSAFDADIEGYTVEFMRIGEDSDYLLSLRREIQCEV